MSTESDIEIDIFLEEIRRLFPDVSERIDSWLDHMGCEKGDRMYASEMEAFSQATTDAIKQNDETIALSHLQYMSKKLQIASPTEREYIDVYYVESLLWDIKDNKVKRWGWSLIPNNLRELYVSMWGQPDF